MTIENGGRLKSQEKFHNSDEFSYRFVGGRGPVSLSQEIDRKVVWTVYFRAIESEINCLSAQARCLQAREGRRERAGLSS